MRTSLVAIAAPSFDLPASIGRAYKPVRVEAFFMQSAIKTLDGTHFESACRVRLTASALSSVRSRRPKLVREIPDHHPRRCSPAGTTSRSRSLNAPHAHAADRGIHFDDQTLARVIIHQHQGADRAAAGNQIGHKIDRPALIPAPWRRCRLMQTARINRLCRRKRTTAGKQRWCPSSALLDRAIPISLHT